SFANPDIPPEIDRIVVKMLEKDRSNRHQSADEVLTELRREKDLRNHARPIDSINENANQPTSYQVAEPPMPVGDEATSKMTQALLLILVVIAVVAAIYLFVS
ncbi:MAG TPA: hypothetical protein VGQ55_05370, partial [Pyrinomonadaceae bacterium]|nr:hypothetical protein [Pyrinomonadaceae bacterium]